MFDYVEMIYDLQSVKPTSELKSTKKQILLVLIHIFKYITSLTLRCLSIFFYSIILAATYTLYSTFFHKFLYNFYASKQLIDGATLLYSLCSSCPLFQVSPLNTLPSTLNTASYHFDGCGYHKLISNNRSCDKIVNLHVWTNYRI